MLNLKRYYGSLVLLIFWKFFNITELGKRKEKKKEAMGPDHVT